MGHDTARCRKSTRREGWYLWEMGRSRQTRDKGLGEGLTVGQRSRRQKNWQSQVGRAVKAPRRNASEPGWDATEEWVNRRPDINLKAPARQMARWFLGGRTQSKKERKGEVGQTARRVAQGRDMFGC